MSQPAIRPEQIVLESEVYLGDWSHSVHSAKRAVDAKATFFFPDDDDISPLTMHQTRAGQGKRRPGKRFRMVLIEDDDTPAPALPPADAGAYGQYAKDLRLSGFCRTPDVWRVLGSDADFRTWVSYQPSVISGQFSEYDDGGNGRCVACHVRRAGESGTAYKAEYACVPMTDAEHRLQHERGESFVYALVCRGQTGRALPGDSATVARAAAQWFDAQRMKIVTAWVWATLKAELGIDSMADAHPDAVFDWARSEGVDNYLPASYRRGA